MSNLADSIKEEVGRGFILLDDDKLFLVSFGPAYKDFAEAFARRRRRLGKPVELRTFAVNIQEANPATRMVITWKKSEGWSAWTKVGST